MGRRRVDKQHALVHLIVTDVVLLWIHAGDYKTCKSERGWDLSEHRTDFSSSSLDRLSSRCLARCSGSIAAVKKTDCRCLAFFWHWASSTSCQLWYHKVLFGPHLLTTEHVSESHAALKTSMFYQRVWTRVRFPTLRASMVWFSANQLNRWRHRLYYEVVEYYF